VKKKIILTLKKINRDFVVVVSENEDRHFFNCDFEYSEEGASPVKITIKKTKR